MERDTRQRQAIRQVFNEANRPLSPREVLTAARPSLPRLGMATVYRALKSLVDEGWLVPVGLPGEADRYEPSGKRHHHHFFCRRCSRVYEIEGCPRNLARLTPDGFQLESHDVLLYGLCADCAPPKPNKPELQHS